MKASVSLVVLMTVVFCGFAVSQVVPNPSTKEPVRKKNHVPLTKEPPPVIDTSTHVTTYRDLVVTDTRLIEALRGPNVQYDEKRLEGYQLEGWTRMIHSVESTDNQKTVKVWVIPRLIAGQAMVCTAMYEEVFAFKDGQLTLVNQRKLPCLIAGC